MSVAAIQSALFERLQSVPGFEVFAGEAAREADGDHIVIGDRTGAPFDDHSARGREGTETVHIWTRGDGSVMRAMDAIAAVREALQGVPLEVTGQEVVALEWEFDTTLKEPGWWHAPVRFRIHTTEES